MCVCRECHNTTEGCSIDGLGIEVLIHIIHHVCFTLPPVDYSRDRKHPLYKQKATELKLIGTNILDELLSRATEPCPWC